MRRPCRMAAGLLVTMAMACGGRGRADELGYYVGGGFGARNADIDGDSVSGAVGSALGESLGALEVLGADRSDATYDAIVGYRFSPLVALEAQYLWLGDASMHASAGSGGVVDARWRLKGPAVALLAGWPISSRWDVYARAGAMFAETDATLVYDAATSDDAPRVKARETTTELHWGAGFAYHATSQWTVRLEFQQIPNAGDADRTGELDVERVTIGWVYHY